MPIHDWTRVKAGIFHAFHQRWIGEISDALNDVLLPPEYYAHTEQQAAPNGEEYGPDAVSTVGGLLLARPRLRPTAETEGSFYWCKKSTIAVRHVSDDTIVAVVDVISPGNKESRRAFRELTDKARQLLQHKIHLLLVDLFPPTKHDPNGLHATLWEEITDQPSIPEPGKQLTVVAYEAAMTVNAYVVPVAVGDPLPEMPLFLEPNGCVHAPLEGTYETVFAKFPRRWRKVLEAT